MRLVTHILYDNAGFIPTQQGIKQHKTADEVWTMTFSTWEINSDFQEDTLYNQFISNLRVSLEQHWA